MIFVVRKKATDPETKEDKKSPGAGTSGDFSWLFMNLCGLAYAGSALFGTLAAITHQAQKTDPHQQDGGRFWNRIVGRYLGICTDGHVIETKPV